MNRQLASPGATPTTYSKVSQVWEYAKLVSEQVSVLYSRSKFSGTLEPETSVYPPDRRVYGRDRYIDTIIEKIENGDNSFCILGPPGIGKSAVGSAILYHRHVKERFGNRRHWARFTGVKTIDAFCDALYRAVCVNADNTKKDIARIPSSAPPNDRLAAVVGMLQTPNSTRLLVLDDLDGVEGPDGDLVQSTLQQLTSIAQLTILITTQKSSLFPQATSQVDLPPLPPRDAKLLFLEVYPYSDVMLDDLLKQLDFHPLAITVVARACQLRGLKPAAVIQGWGDRGLLSLPAATSELVGVAALTDAFDSSVNRVSSPEAAKLLRILSTLPTGVMARDLGDIAPTVLNIEEMTGLLSSISLASVEGQRLRVLSPIRSHVVKHHHLDRESRNNLYFYFFNLAKEGLRRPGDAYFPAAIKKLVQYQENIETILWDALDECDVPAIEATLHYSSPRCAIRPRLDLIKKAIKAATNNESIANRSQEQALRDGSMSLTARCIQRFGEMNIEAGTFDDWFREAIPRFEMLKDYASIEHCKIYMAHGIWINDTKQGIKELECVRDRLVALGDIAGEARCQLKLADYYSSENQIEDAREACRSSCSKYKDPHHRALCKQVLAETCHRQGQVEAARALLVEAIDTLTEFGDRSGVAKCQSSLAFVYQALRRTEDAQVAFRHAIMEYDALGEKLNAAFVRWWLGKIAEDDEAIRLFQEAIPAFWESRFVFAGAECRLELGLLCMMIGRLDEALLHFQIARPQLQRNDTPHHAADCLLYIILCQSRIGDEENAKLTLESGKHELHSRLSNVSRTVRQPEDLSLSKLLDLPAVRPLLRQPDSSEAE